MVLAKILEEQRIKPVMTGVQGDGKERRENGWREKMGWEREKAGRKRGEWGMEKGEKGAQGRNGGRYEGGGEKRAMEKGENGGGREKEGGKEKGGEGRKGGGRREKDTTMHPAQQPLDCKVGTLTTVPQLLLKKGWHFLQKVINESLGL